ncbi:MAG TPA: TrbI/VirB10 family protein, partial [Polyangiaceae bacterium]|nr:TrbI/VirB10 family protein [Polyangiaceae bacterium]
MTTAAPEIPPSESALDPHAPKLSPDDPRLSVGRPRGRTLRAGPIGAILASLLGGGVLAVTLAFHPPQARTQAGADPSAAPPPPVVPDTIKNAQPNRASVRAPFDAGLAERAPLRGADTEDPDQRAERDTLRKARGAGIFFESAPAPQEERSPQESPARSPELPPGSGAAPTTGGPSDPNLQEHKNAFLGGKGGVATADYLQRAMQPPRSPYEIKAGTVLPAVLITAINSDLPGPVIAQVREHVYDTVTGDYLLVPQGSRLVAQYDSMVAWGQERVLVCWNRLILPNGDSMDLACMPAADLKGAAGLAKGVTLGALVGVLGIGAPQRGALGEAGVEGR